MSTQIESIKALKIAKTLYGGFQCTATVKVSSDPSPYRFKLLVPLSAQGVIVEKFGQCGDSEVGRVFESRIQEYVLGGHLEVPPSGRVVDLGTLHYLEVPGAPS